MGAPFYFPGNLPVRLSLIFRRIALQIMSSHVVTYPKRKEK